MTSLSAAGIRGFESEEEAADAVVAVRLVGLSLGRTRTKMPAPISDRELMIPHTR